MRYLVVTSVILPEGLEACNVAFKFPCHIYNNFHVFMSGNDLWNSAKWNKENPLLYYSRLCILCLAQSVPPQVVQEEAACI